MLRYKAPAYFALLLAVFIWGVNFEIVWKGIEAWKGHTFAFLAARFWLACLFYAVFLSARRGSVVKALSLNLKKVRWAAVVGGVLAAAYVLQTLYLVSGNAINAAFLTSTTVLWAPLIAKMFRQFRQPVARTTFVGALVALVGIGFMYLGELRVEGEMKWTDWFPLLWLPLLAAIAFAVEILLVSRHAPEDKGESMQWTTVSCVCVALLMTGLALWLEEPSNLSVTQLGGWGIFAVVFSGLVATAIALGLQNWAQAQRVNGARVIDGPRAAIIATLEPVFTTIFVGVLILLNIGTSVKPAQSQLLFWLQAVGCFLILIGAVVSEAAEAKRAQMREGSEQL